MRTATTSKGLLLALCAAMISGVSVFVNSYGVREFGDATVYTTAKNAFAAALLVAVTAVLGVRGRPVVHVPRRSPRLAALVVIGVIGGSVPFVLFFEGLAHATSGPVQAQFINKTLVVWVALLAVGLLGERLGLLQAGAVVLLLAGQVALSGGLDVFRMQFGRGEAMIFAATLLWALEVVAAKKLLRWASSWTVALARMALGSALLLSWVFVSGRGGRLAAMDAHQWAWVSVTGTLLAAYVATWLAALALAPAVNVTAVLVAAVPVTALLDAVVRHTALGPQLGGLALVVAGCVLVIMRMLPLRARRRTVPA